MMDPEPPARTYLKVSIRFNRADDRRREGGQGSLEAATPGVLHWENGASIC